MGPHGAVKNGELRAAMCYAGPQMLLAMGTNDVSLRRSESEPGEATFRYVKVRTCHTKRLADEGGKSEYGIEHIANIYL